MKTIIIDEKTVSVDGVIFERKENIFIPKIGQWVISMMQSGDKIERVIKVTSDGLTYDDNGKKESHTHWEWKGYVRPATHSEIESHLIKVAKEKYPNGSLVKSAMYGDTFKYDELHRFEYELEGDVLWLGGMGLYFKGKWAEIIPSKKPLPKTKEEFKTFLNEYDPFEDSINEFLKYYE